MSDLDHKQREVTPLTPRDPVDGSKISSFPSITQISRPYFTHSEISHLLRQTVDDAHSASYGSTKMRVFQFSFHIIKQLKFPLRVLSTTMNYYQRFYLFNRFQASEEAQDIGDLERDPFMVAVACLFLAAKNEDCIKKLKEIQSVANKLRDIDDTQRISSISALGFGAGSFSNNGSTGSTSINSSSISSSSTVADLQRRAVMSLEFKLLQIIKFDFNNGATVSIKSSDQLVTQFCKKLNINYRLSLFSWLINFDLMSSPLCLVIPPHCIALAIIIISLNLKPKELNITHEMVDEESDEELNAKLDSFDCYVDFRCPESLVNEGILYVLDYYIHSYQHSILNQYLPAIDRETGKEQIFKFMEFKSRFNDLKTLNEHSTATRPLLQQDKYLQPWDYSIATKGTARFMPGNKRRRFSRESGKPRQMSNS
ncbi:hypothetical protein G9P44_004822 [Scheffersomyces stipitis]|nr:hypothetical protein G9P44_004822 [Scheffersomyces stipitis]